jgi:UDP-N-acetylglucosamine diphosphorylase / glucose-1-phosphate thymidylyltransferase / UDP-N-acetylgalactosamine diphosphorylase / glucosamine-1-phosphate N-acetyltransferase / galactosamine-1-phosphate N-acetyltransferase
MNLPDLFAAEMEPDLNEWVRKFNSLDDLFFAIPQLYAKLKVQNIQGIVEDGAAIVGPVHVGPGAIVHGQAVIRGPAIVGPSTEVHSHAEIQAGCFIGSNCSIGHGCSIVGTLIMSNVYIQPGAFIRNSVIGFGSVVGPGASLGATGKFASQHSSELGVALGDYAIAGANATINPGTVIGSRTIIGDCVLAHGVYEPNHTVTFSQALEIKPTS